MSSGHHTQGHHDPIDPRFEHQLALLMDDPVFVKAVAAYRKEDDGHDVAYLAGSNEDGETIDFDRHFAAAIEAGKVKYEDQAYDPRPFIRVHEAIEGAILRGQFQPESWVLGPIKGSGYPNPAHDIALVAERRTIEHAGLDWKKYSDPLEPFIKEDEEEQIKNPPPDILRQPYETQTGSTNQKVFHRMISASSHPSGGRRADRQLVESRPAGEQVGRRLYGSRAATHAKSGGPMDWYSQGVGARLTAAKRKKLPSGSFALPGGRYPIPDASHARNALARGSQHASPAELATIKAKVRAKYPGIQVGARQNPAPPSSPFNQWSSPLPQFQIRERWPWPDQELTQGKQAGARSHDDEYQFPRRGGKAVWSHGSGVQFGARMDAMDARVSAPWYEGMNARGGDFDPYGAGRYRGMNPALDPRSPVQRGGGNTVPSQVDPNTSIAPKSTMPFGYQRGGARMPTHPKTEIKISFGHKEQGPGTRAGSQGGVGVPAQVNKQIGQGARHPGPLERAVALGNNRGGVFPKSGAQKKAPGVGTGQIVGARMPSTSGERGKTFAQTKETRVGGNPGMPKDGSQYGARMPGPILGRDHSLAMASATHLHRMGHINDSQLKAVHAHAKNKLAAGAPSMMPSMNAQMPPTMAQMPSFGSLGGSTQPNGTGQQMGARMQYGARPEW
jgi:hypothetical protein